MQYLVYIATRATLLKMYTALLLRTAYSPLARLPPDLSLSTGSITSYKLCTTIGVFSQPWLRFVCVWLRLCAQFQARDVLVWVQVSIKSLLPQDISEISLRQPNVSCPHGMRYLMLMQTLTKTFVAWCGEHKLNHTQTKPKLIYP